MRDRDVRNAIQAALIATGQFDLGSGGSAVWIWGLPEDYGTGSSEQAAAAIVPMSSRQEDLWDAAPAGGLVITSRVGIVLLYRHPDPQLRDEGVELLLDTAANALNGQQSRRPDFPADRPDRSVGLAAAEFIGAADSTPCSPINTSSRAGTSTTPPRNEDQAMQRNESTISTGPRSRSPRPHYPRHERQRRPGRQPDQVQGRHRSVPDHHRMVDQEPHVSITTADVGTMMGFVPGTVGTLTATLNDAKRPAAARDFTLATRSSRTPTRQAQHAQFGSVTGTWQCYSTDGRRTRYRLRGPNDRQRMPDADADAPVSTPRPSSPAAGSSTGSRRSAGSPSRCWTSTEQPANRLTSENSRTAGCS